MYIYEDIKKELFTDKGLKTYLSVYNEVQRLLALSGSFTMKKILQNTNGDNYLRMACVEKLVEDDIIKELDIDINDRVFLPDTQNILYSNV